MVARALSSSVDFPTPGSPPSNTSEPGTSPPPSTRSSSGTPDEIRAASATSTSTNRRSGLGGTWDCATCPATSSTSVPKAEQPGHFPNQRPAVYPHSVQLNWTATDFATRPPYGRSRTQTVTRFERLRAETETAPPSGAASAVSREGLGSPRRIGAQPRLCSMRRSSCGGDGSLIPFPVVHRVGSLPNRYGVPGCAAVGRPPELARVRRQSCARDGVRTAPRSRGRGGRKCRHQAERQCESHRPENTPADAAIPLRLRALRRL